MSNLQIAFAVGLPIVAVLASLVVSIRHASGIRDEIRGTREDLRVGCANIDKLFDRLFERDN
jgi:hypothetical protein